jgi:myo-inositol-1(or 4)-monophosphatase
MKEIVQIASEAAIRAGHLIAACFGNAAVTLKDSTYNLVTDADLRSEEFIAGFLLEKMPGCTCLGEETHHAALKADRLWIVDPLDGTTNFAHGIPHFGVSVAYAEKGTILAGAVYDPMRDELFSASLGQGATLNGDPIHVSGNRQLAQSIIGTGFYYDRNETMEKTLEALRTLFKQDIHCMRRMGASSLDLTWLAAGRFDGYFEYTLSPWDFAAGLLILTEAGGKAIDARTSIPADLFSSGLICSNGLIHEALVACTLNAPRFGEGHESSPLRNDISQV